MCNHSLSCIRHSSSERAIDACFVGARNKPSVSQSVSQSLDDHRREKKAEEINRVLKMRRHNKFVSHCLLLSALVPLIHGYNIDKSSNQENEEENEFLGCGGYQRHHMKITPV